MTKKNVKPAPSKEKELTKDEAFNAIVEGMKIMGWDKKEEEKVISPRPLWRCDINK
jgi:hypothetical protein